MLTFSPYHTTLILPAFSKEKTLYLKAPHNVHFSLLLGKNNYNRPHTYLLTSLHLLLQINAYTSLFHLHILAGISLQFPLTDSFVFNYERILSISLYLNHITVFLLHLLSLALYMLNSFDYSLSFVTVLPFASFSLLKRNEVFFITHSS